MIIKRKNRISILCTLLILTLFMFALVGCISGNGAVNMSSSSSPSGTNNPSTTDPSSTQPTTTNMIGNTNGNLVNQGIAAISGEWVYFSSLSHPFSSTKGELCKAKIDGSNKIKLSNDMPYYINVVGNWIYFINASDNGYIYKINVDGTGRAKIGDDKSLRMSVIGDWIYYTSDGLLYKIKTDGTGRTSLLNNKVGIINVNSDWIFYFDVPNSTTYQPRSIYKIKTDGTENTKVQSDAGDHFEVVGDWIYYFYRFGKDNSIYKIKTDGTGCSKVSEGVTTTQMNVVGDLIYYVNSEGLKKINTNGSQNTLLLSNPKATNIINVVGEWIYFSSSVVTDNGFEPFLFKMKNDGTLVQQVN